MGVIFICEGCGAQCMSNEDWTDEDVIREMEATFGDIPMDQRAVVCDDCYALDIKTGRSAVSEKWMCRECGWRGTDDQFLWAPNPFDPDFKMVGCPECKEPNTMDRACDHEGCWQAGTMGTPTPDGYKNTCFEHRPEKK